MLTPPGRKDVGSTQVGCLLVILLLILVGAIIVILTGDGFCFEYC